MITLLQHTHPKLPHYNDKEWDWLRGALATVDRSFGFLDFFFHHIADTHVAHHLFSNMPHYHAEEVRPSSLPSTNMGIIQAGLVSYTERQSFVIMSADLEISTNCSRGVQHQNLPSASVEDEGSGEMKGV